MKEPYYRIYVSPTGLIDPQVIARHWSDRDTAIEMAALAFDKVECVEAVEVWRHEPGLFGEASQRVYRQSIPW